MNNFPRASRLWLQALEAVSSIERGECSTFGEVLNELAIQYGTAPALLDDEQILSFSELAHRANLYAGWARTEALAPGRTVALLMQNRPDYVAIWAGLTQMGCVVALINTNLTHDALAHAIKIAGASALIIETSLQEHFTAIAPHFKDLRVWRYGDGEGFWPRIEAAIAGEDGARPPPSQFSGETPALLIYTSGTTGLPKAAKVSHARILQWSYWFAGMMDTKPSDRLYNCLPMYHSTGGVSAIGAMLVHGGSVYIRRRFSARRFWPEIMASGSTIFQYIGELCRYLLHASPHPLEERHQLRLCCGNGLRENVWREFEARFNIPRIIEFYAMTEGALSLYNCEGRPGAIGHVPGFLAHRFPIALVCCDPETGTLIRDEAGLCIGCAQGEAGEAIGRLDPKNLSSARRFEGYTDHALSERKLARDVFVPGDLWYRTGDLMRRDGDGFYYFVDRLGDAFRWKGENISASETAAAISRFPEIVDSTVFGVPIPGHEGRACMAAIAADSDINFSALRLHVHDTLPSYARPIFIRMCSAIQRTGTFKISMGGLAAEGYSAAPLHELWFDDRESQTYVPCSEALLTLINTGAIRL